MMPHSGEAHRSQSKVASYGPIASEEAQNQETSGSPSPTCRHRRSDASCHPFNRDAARYPAARDVNRCRFDRSITKRPSRLPSFWTVATRSPLPRVAVGMCCTLLPARSPILALPFVLTNSCASNERFGRLHRAMANSRLLRRSSWHPNGLPCTTPGHT